MGLDVVVTVDTSVVHLAGALGKPVLLMDRYDNCWRWLHGREDTPWYPTLRIIRQTTPRQWIMLWYALRRRWQTWPHSGVEPSNKKGGPHICRAAFFCLFWLERFSRMFRSVPAPGLKSYGRRSRSR